MSEKKYQVVCYMRIDPEEGEWDSLTHAEAKAEIDQLKLMQPENIYAIEVIRNEPQNDGKGVPMESDA